MKYLGIDLGGINVAAAVVSGEGTILGRSSIPTPRGAAAVADAMAEASRAAAAAAGVPLERVVSVGIGAPGALTRPGAWWSTGAIWTSGTCP